MSVRKRLSKLLVPRIGLVLPPLVVGLVGSGLFGVVGVAAGVTTYLPNFVVPRFGWTMSPTAVLFAGVFVVLFVLGLLVQLYRRNRATIHEWWDARSATARAVLTGLAVAVLLGTALGAAAYVGAVQTTWAVVGTLVAWLLGIVGKLVWDARGPDGSAGTVRTKLIVSTGVAQTSRLHSLPVALVVGTLVAVLAIAGGTVVLDVGLAVSSIVGLLAGAIVAHLVWRRTEPDRDERTDIAIVDVADRDNYDTYELSLRNEGSETIDLAGSKLLDTDTEQYSIDIEVHLRPAETTTVKIPEEFSLRPNDGVAYSWMNLEVPDGEETPVLVTRGGQRYRLRWECLDLDAEPEFPWEQPALEAGTDGSPQD